MKLEELKQLVYSSYKVYILRRKLYGTVGCCRLNKSGSVVIMLDPKLKEDTECYNLVLKHELGHIYFRHFDNREDNYEEIKKLYKKKTNKNASLKKCHTILNICEDIVIHDCILTAQEVRFLENFLDMKLCTSKSYNAPPFLLYNEYYDYVIQQRSDPEKSNMQLPFEGNPGNGPCTEGEIDDDEDEDEPDDEDGVPDNKPGGNPTDKEGGYKKKDDNQENPPKEEGDSGDPMNPDEDSTEEGGGGEEEDDFNKKGGSLENEDENGNTIDKTDKEIEDEGGVLQRLGSKGTGGVSDKDTEFVSDEPHKQLMEILKQLIVVKERVSMSVDSIRKTEKLRLKDGVFRKSLRQKLVKVKTRNPVTLLIDCSGSMDQVIRSVLSTIIEVKDKIDPDSELILWNTVLGYEGRMKDIKSEELSYKSGGTRLSPGIIYCRKKYPNHKIVFISDYEDQNNPHLRDTILKYRSSIIGICLGSKDLDDIIAEFAGMNTNFMLKTDKRLYDHYINWFSSYLH